MSRRRPLNPDLDFVEKHRPRHPVEELRQKLKQPHTMFTLGPPPVEVVRPRTLIDLYLNGDVRPIEEDVRRRPDHYTSEQRELVEDLVLKRKRHAEPTQRQLDELFLTYHQPTETAKQRRDLVKTISSREADVADDPDVRAELERNGDLAKSPGAAEAPTFENQKYDFKIII